MTLFLLLFFLAPKVEITILYTSGMGGYLKKRPARWINPDYPPPLGGIGSLATAIRRERDKEENILLLHAGDIVGGNIIGEGREAKVSVKAMNLLGYDVAVPGVVDFAVGIENLKEELKDAKFKVVVSNLKKDGKFAFSPYVLIERAGIVFGIFGLVPQYLPLLLPKKVFDGVEVEEEKRCAESMVSLLRREGADFIIALTSIGIDRDTSLAHEVKGIDVIIGGTQGSGFRRPWEEPTTHTIVGRVYRGLSDLGYLKLVIDSKYKQIVSFEGKLLSLLEEESPLDWDFLRAIGLIDSKYGEFYNSFEGR